MMHHRQFSQQGSHSGYCGEAMPRAANRQGWGNPPIYPNPPGGRMRGSITGPPHFANPAFHQRKFLNNFPKFVNDKGVNIGELRFSESLEITSNGPFLPERATSNLKVRPNSLDGDVAFQSSQPVKRHGGQMAECTLNDPLMKPQTTNATDDQSGVVPNGHQKKRRKQTGLSNNAPMSREGLYMPVPPFEDERPFGSCPSTSEPPSHPVEMPRQKPGLVWDGHVESDQAASLCNKLWAELERAMNFRERALKGREVRVEQINTEKEAVMAEVKMAAALKDEVCLLREQAKDERMRIDLEARKIREDKEGMERTSTDIAVQMAELKQMQRQLEKEKAALYLQEGELDARRKALDERESALLARERTQGAIKEETRTTVFKQDGPQLAKNVVNTTREVILSSTLQQDTPDLRAPVSELSPVRKCSNEVISEQSLTLVTPAKNEPVGMDLNGAHDVQCGHGYNAGEEERVGREPVSLPISTKKKYQRVSLPQRKEVEDMKPLEGLALDSSLPKKKSTQKQDSHVLGGKPLSYNVSMKRNHVSIETALQEDAPGLLEVLIKSHEGTFLRMCSGILSHVPSLSLSSSSSLSSQQLHDKGLLEDMHVYGDTWTEEPGASASDFGELQRVIGKLWGPAVGQAKDLKAQGSNAGHMPRYCLACLLSLIEQTKSLRRRKWPVEWGWCRPLHAFLFVFEKHNRIVMERPEYGFATYFFELVHSLPVKWQVQRLITVMSVASNGRAALMENRQLEVGRDLSAQEAAILEDYGWNPSSGLGSLLNFCHRVVHDYNKGGDTADLGTDWKMKIGKLLMDGHDQGSIVQLLPRKLQTCSKTSHSTQNQTLGLYSKAEPS